MVTYGGMAKQPVTVPVVSIGMVLGTSAGVQCVLCLDVTFRASKFLSLFLTDGFVVE